MRASEMRCRYYSGYTIASATFLYCGYKTIDLGTRQFLKNNGLKNRFQQNHLGLHHVTVYV